MYVSPNAACIAGTTTLINSLTRDIPNYLLRLPCSRKPAPPCILFTSLQTCPCVPVDEIEKGLETDAKRPKEEYLPFFYDACNIHLFCFVIRKYKGVLVWIDFQDDRSEGLERLQSL